MRIAPGPEHWKIFTDICKKSSARGNLVPDAYYAAIAIEQRCTGVSTDGDFARFNGLDWVNPLDT